MDRCDALIIGGGPAGATAALLLAQAGWSVIVVEGKQFPRRKVCGEYLSATNWPLLVRLGLAEAFGDLAGPPVRRTAVMVGKRSTLAALPRPTDDACRWGRSLSRQHLDTLLLENARQAGADIRQPCRCVELSPIEQGFRVQLESANHTRVQIEAQVVIAAHGSWEIGPLATQRQAKPAKASDWLAFKAHFHSAALPNDLMPLLSFPEGYGGMVNADEGQASLSCCLRRSRLERLPRSSQQTAGDTVLEHILDSTPVMRPILERAVLAGPWLSAGPIQPGLRSCYRDGVYVIGNAAGEAHPVVAEGISMAMQSAWLLVERLMARREDLRSQVARQFVGREYTAAWRRSFAPRIHAAAAIAQWASRPRLVLATLPLLRGCPPLLTLGARLSGKARVVVPAAQRLAVVGQGGT